MRTYSRDNFEFGGNYVRMIVPYNWIPKEGEMEESNAGNNNDTKNVGNSPKKLYFCTMKEEYKTHSL